MRTPSSCRSADCSLLGRLLHIASNVVRWQPGSSGRLRKHRQHETAPLWRLAASVIALLQAATVSAADYKAPAQFKITNDVVSRGVTAFTATIPAVGNNLVDEGSGFEPIVYRNKYKALENSADRIVVAADPLSHYDTLREGFLDGADVQVYRISNGRFAMVREDRVAERGFHVSGWWQALRENQVVPAGTTRFSFRWESWNRPGQKYYFTVKAIDRSGNLSPAAPALAVESPAKIGKNETPPAYPEFKPLKPAADMSAPPAPANLRATLASNGSLLLEWSPVNADDLAGYIVYRSDYPPERQSGYYLQLSRSAASGAERINAGDMIIVSKKFYSTSRKRFMSNRVWDAWNEYNVLLPGLIEFFPDEKPGRSWELARHRPDTPVEEPGETFLKLDLAAGVAESIGIWNHSGTAQDYYEVLEKRPYTIEVWLRREKGAGTATFKFRGQYAQGFVPVVFDVGTEWKKYTATFTPPAVLQSGEPNRMELEVTGPGTFDIDNFRIYRADTGYLDYTEQEYAVLKSSAIQTLRTHGLIKTSFRTYDLTQLTNSGGVMSVRREARLNTLPQTLKIMRKAGALPWLQVEFHLSPREWLGLVEYMAAPYDPRVDNPSSKPWAYKRYAQGQTKPWVEEFDRIYFELGNETWNGLFAPWVFDGMSDAVTHRAWGSGELYGLFQEHVIAVLKSSPYWRSAGLDKKFVFMLGGWAGQDYGRDATAVSPSSTYLTTAAYNGGWDEGEGPPQLNAAGLFNVLAQVNQAAIPGADAQQKQIAELKAKVTTRIRLGTYEGGPGYALNGLNHERVTPEQQRQQEQVMKSLAAGTATLDSFLARAYRGYDIQNFFMLQPGGYWSSHAKWYRGGQAYPAWKAIALFNNEATGDMLRTEAASVPAAALPSLERRQAVAEAPLAAAYATRKGDRVSVIVVSRKVPDYPVAGDDGYTPVTISLPFNNAQAVTLFRMTGDPRANNLLTDNVRFEKVAIPASRAGANFTLNAETGADSRGLPPASTFVYVFDGVGRAVATAARPGR
ncbi:MAG: glycosyl hydrolase, family 52 [Betaproteobacteria bacterium]|nr:glycosyl hydrolase, family 52 [Betaproteobacteria bacterium]